MQKAYSSCVDAHTYLSPHSYHSGPPLRLPGRVRLDIFALAKIGRLVRFYLGPFWQGNHFSTDWKLEAHVYPCV